MTLIEYCSQTEVIRMPKVILDKSEYIVHSKINGMQNIEIPAIWERFKTSANYVKKDGQSCLLTQDEHGNPKYFSCFYINE